MSKTNSNKPARQSNLRWVNADDLKVNPAAQREFRPAWAKEILSEFNIDKFEVPHVNRREDGTEYIMDGQHGTWAYRQWIGEGQKVQVWLYNNLTEEEEADVFLSLNNKKVVDGMAKFKVGVTAGYAEESDIDRIARAAGCHVNYGTDENAISAVGALRLIYTRHGAANLAQTLRVIRESFAVGGYERPVLLGISMVIARYSALDEAKLIRQLAAIRNGWKGLVQLTAIFRDQTGANQPECAAAAVVQFYNKGRGSKLPNWWREDLAA